MPEAESVPSDVWRASEGDDVRVATTMYEWSNPMPVEEVDAHEFEAPLGEDFRARRVVLDGSKGATYAFDAVEGDDPPIVESVNASAKARGQLTQFTLGPAPRELDDDTISAVTERVDDPYVDHENAHPDRRMLGRLPLSLGNPKPTDKVVHINRSESFEETRCGMSREAYYQEDVDIGAWPPAHIEWCADCLADLGVEPVDDADDEPTPRDIVGESNLPARVALPDLLEAVDGADTLLEIQQSLSLQRSVAKSVLRDLGLLGNGPSFPTGDERAQRLAALRNGEVPPEYLGGDSMLSTARGAADESDRPEGDDSWRKYHQGETA